MPDDVTSETVDVLVIGSGNAGLSAALAAAEEGVSVLVIDRAPRAWAGGNTAFTAGAYRTAFESVDALLELVPELDREEVDIPVYDAAAFRADLHRVTDGRCDAALADHLVTNSFSATAWLAAYGIPFRLAVHRQSYKIDGRYRFWGGLVLCVEDGGRGLTAAQMRACAAMGVEMRFDVEVEALLGDGGVRVRGGHHIAARAVVLAAGGFEASAAMRVQHLGADWAHAYVRGTPYNTGRLLTLALRAGARPAGDWAGCHATCWDAHASPDRGDPTLTHQYTKSGYPLGLMVNAAGRRFVDEGRDLRNYTYAAMGRAILAQPDAVAFQLWDAAGAAWLRPEEYAPDVVERITADSIAELGVKLETKGLRDRPAFEATLRAYNAAVRIAHDEHPERTFNPSVRDGLSTRSSQGGLALDKTNWARPITQPPFLAVKVACGVTFTFGGLAVDPETAGVLDTTGQPIPGLYCAGEMLGGLFSGNYPGGSGLTAGAVFGRTAGSAAAAAAKAWTL